MSRRGDLRTWRITRQGISLDPLAPRYDLFFPFLKKIVSDEHRPSEREGPTYPQAKKSKSLSISAVSSQKKPRASFSLFAKQTTKKKVLITGREASNQRPHNAH